MMFIQSVVCPLYFGLGRGWTPSHGGGKPYNYEMAYNVTVLYTRVQYSASAGDVTMLLQRLTKKVYRPLCSFMLTLVLVCINAQHICPCWGRACACAVPNHCTYL